jgi:hypothetical protein
VKAEDASLPMLFNFTLEFHIKNIHKYQKESELTFQVPALPKVNAHRKTPLEIIFIYLGNKEIYKFLRQAA